MYKASTLSFFLNVSFNCLAIIFYFVLFSFRGSAALIFHLRLINTTFCKDLVSRVIGHIILENPQGWNITLWEWQQFMIMGARLVCMLGE